MAKYKEPLLNGQAYKTISQVDFDSSKRRFRQYFIIAYDLSDQVIHSDHTGTEEWSPIPPGTSFWDTAWAYCQKL